MHVYRCSFHNKDGQTIRVELGDFETDGEAIGWGQRCAAARPHLPVVKIWQDRRLVHCIVTAATRGPSGSPRPPRDPAGPGFTNR
jgi:hypothetical protein